MGMHYVSPGNLREGLLTGKATIVKRVLLVGGSGMLGSNIVVSNRPVAHSAAFELYPTYLRNRIAHPRALRLDISDRDNVLKQVEAIKPEVIVHAGGMVKPTTCEKELAVAHRVNVEGTAHLVEAAKSVGARFIFLSLDLGLWRNSAASTEAPSGVL